MKQSGGISMGCLALLTVAACSSPEAPPAEGSSRGTITFAGGLYTINISGGQPPQMDNRIMGNTVLDGRNGYHVSCTVSGQGQAFSASILSPDGTSLEVSGANASDNATLSAYLYGTSTSSGTGAGTINVLSDLACKLVQVDPLTSPGSIWAKFQCQALKTQSALSDSGHTDVAEFLFSGCKK